MCVCVGGGGGGLQQLFQLIINPITTLACKISGLKSAHIHASKQADGPKKKKKKKKSILCIWIEILSRTHVNGGKAFMV